jgi:hypothetical protein
MGPLLIEGNLSVAAISVEGQTAIRDTVRALVTGGRGLLPRFPGRPFRVVGDEGDNGITVLSIRLRPEIERRLQVSGGHLDDDSILAGIAQIFPGFTRDDVMEMALSQMTAVHREGQEFAMQQMSLAITYADERALHKAYEMARKVIGLHGRISAAMARKGTTGPSVEGQSAPGRSPGTNTTGEEQRR